MGQGNIIEEKYFGKWLRNRRKKTIEKRDKKREKRNQIRDDRWKGID